MKGFVLIVLFFQCISFLTVVILSDANSIIPGKYRFERSENFDAYMQAIGIGFFWRKIGATAKPLTEFIKNGDEWTMRTSTALKMIEIKFHLGVPFDEKTIDGRQCRSVVTLEKENRMIHKMNCTGTDADITVVREFSPTDMKMFLEAGPVKSKRFYRRV